MAARGGGAKNAERRGRMPAFLVMMVMDTAADPRFGLEPGDIGGNEVRASTLLGLGDCEQSRQDRCRGMAAQRVADIIKIERVRRGAVDQRSVERDGAAVAAKNKARTGRATQGRGNDPRAILAGAGERHADRVEDRRLCPIDSLARQRLMADRDDLLSDLFDQCHRVIPIVVASGAKRSSLVPWSA